MELFILILEAPMGGRNQNNRLSLACYVMFCPPSAQNLLWRECYQRRNIVEGELEIALLYVFSDFSPALLLHEDTLFFRSGNGQIINRTS